MGVGSSIAKVAEEFRMPVEDMMESINDFATEQSNPSMAHAAAFLCRDTFTSMYMGGTVIAILPLLTGILQPQITNPGDERSPPTLEDLKSKQKIALEAVKLIRLDEQ